METIGEEDLMYHDLFYHQHVAGCITTLPHYSSSIVLLKWRMFVIASQVYIVRVMLLFIEQIL
jgi:hypothetical protein